MGVDFTFCDVSWSYGGFHRFRRRLAAEIGIDLDCMVGFGGEVPWDSISDPIVPLLDHSDCDGDIAPDVAVLVAPRLRELVASWPVQDYDRQMALRLADGLEAAANAGEAILFC